MEDWANGAYIRDKVSEAGALGYIKGIRALINVDAQQLKGMIEHE